MRLTTKTEESQNNVFEFEGNVKSESLFREGNKYTHPFMPFLSRLCCDDRFQHLSTQLISR